MLHQQHHLSTIHIFLSQPHQYSVFLLLVVRHLFWHPLIHCVGIFCSVYSPCHVPTLEMSIPNWSACIRAFKEKQIIQKNHHNSLEYLMNIFDFEYIHFFYYVCSVFCIIRSRLIPPYQLYSQMLLWFLAILIWSTIMAHATISTDPLICLYMLGIYPSQPFGYYNPHWGTSLILLWKTFMVFIA